MAQLHPDIVEYYLRVKWPIWLWMVQIVELHTEKDQIVWDKSKVVGEILIDATANPQTDFGGAFCMRLKSVILELEEKVKDEGGKKSLKIKLYPDDKADYPLV